MGMVVRQSAVVAYLVILLMRGFSAGASGAEPKFQGDAAVLAAIAEEYLQNREGLRRFACDFEVRAGHCESYDKAISGEFREGTVTARGIWVVDGDAMRYELSMDSAYVERQIEAAEASGSNSVTWLFPEMKLLRNATMDLSYWPHLGLSVIGKRDEKTCPFVTPVDMGIMGECESKNPAQRIRSALDGRGKWALRGADGNDGEGVYVAEFTDDLTNQPETKSTISIWFDSSRGWFPIRCDTGVAGKPTKIRTIVSKMIESPEGGWIPERSIQIKSPDRTDGKPVWAREISVIRFDPISQPSPEDLRIEIPKGTAIRYSGTRGSQFVIGSDLNVDPSQLESVGKVSAETGEKARTAAQATAVPSKAAIEKIEKAPGTRKWVIVINAVAIAGLLAAIVMSRLRRRKG